MSGTSVGSRFGKGDGTYFTVRSRNFHAPRHETLTQTGPAGHRHVTSDLLHFCTLEIRYGLADAASCGFQNESSNERKAINEETICCIVSLVVRLFRICPAIRRSRCG